MIKISLELVVNLNLRLQSSNKILNLAFVIDVQKRWIFKLNLVVISIHVLPVLVLLLNKGNSFVFVEKLFRVREIYIHDILT